MRSQSRIHTAVLFLLISLAAAGSAISIYTWVLVYLLGPLLLVPAVALTLASMLSGVVWFFARKRYREERDALHSVEVEKLAIAQENLRMSQAMKSWIIAMRAIVWTNPDALETVNAFSKLVNDTKVPNEVQPVIEKMIEIASEARKKSKHKIKEKA